jgi:hypothetical protein
MNPLKTAHPANFWTPACVNRSFRLLFGGVRWLNVVSQSVGI